MISKLQDKRTSITEIFFVCSNKKEKDRVKSVFLVYIFMNYHREIVWYRYATKVNMKKIKIDFRTFVFFPRVGRISLFYSNLLPRWFVLFKNKNITSTTYFHCLFLIYELRSLHQITFFLIEFFFIRSDLYTCKVHSYVWHIKTYNPITSLCSLF